MKKKVVTLLGNNSGRNLGDATILSAILDRLSDKVEGVEFLVPSIKPKFIDSNYGSTYNVKGVDVRPHTLSLRLLGVPTFWSILKSDVALICDGIIFGHKLFSPHNFLITLIFVVPFARLVGCKVVCFSCGIGPFPSRLSKIMARWVINLCDLVIMREHDSKKLAEEIGVVKQIQVTGDAAFVNPISGDEAAQRIAGENGIDLNRPLLGVNITPYLDSWLKKEERGLTKDIFLDSYAQAINAFLDNVELGQGERPQVAVFSCSPMDEGFSERLAEKVSASVIDNTRYLSHDIQALMRRCGLLIGMRFHALVLASAAGAPIVGLVYAPKVKGYMRYLESEDYCIELKDVLSPDFRETVLNAWINRDELKERQQGIVNVLRAGAEDAFDQLKDKYFSY